MKKTIILSSLVFMSTTVFGMLNVRLAKQVIKKNNPKQFCENQKFNYDDLLLQAIDKNNALEKKISLLERKIEALQNPEKIIELSPTEETTVYRSEKDMRSNGTKHMDEE